MKSTIGISGSESVPYTNAHTSYDAQSGVVQRKINKGSPWDLPVSTWDLHGISMGLHGSPWGLPVSTWDLHGISMGLHGSPWGLRGISLCLLGIHIGLHGSPWDLHGSPWVSMGSTWVLRWIIQENYPNGTLQVHQRGTGWESVREAAP